MHETPEDTLANAKRSLAVQREGGTHRPAKSIGRGSAELKRASLVKRAKLFGMMMLAIMAAVVAAGLVIGGIGFTGVMITAAAIVAAVLFFAFYPSVKVPRREQLTQGNPQQMVARTELWLEAQRPALPAPAVAVVDRLGVQLDALGVQLEAIDPAHPAMNEVRELVGEYIPETIDNYRKIPQHLRAQEHAGSTADSRLTASLTRLSDEVDRVTRRLAEGALDDLAVKSRYLEYRHGGDEMLADMTGDRAGDAATGEESGSGVPLPDFTRAPDKTPEPR